MVKKSKIKSEEVKFFTVNEYYTVPINTTQLNNRNKSRKQIQTVLVLLFFNNEL